MQRNCVSDNGMDGAELGFGRGVLDGAMREMELS
jgi:hypothetical protein